jgi:hypothetical protein
VRRWGQRGRSCVARGAEGRAHNCQNWPT